MITAKIIGINTPKNFIWSDKEKKFVFPASTTYIEVSDGMHKVVCFAHDIANEEELKKVMSDNYCLVAYMDGYKVKKLDKEEYKIIETKNKSANSKIIVGNSEVPKYNSLFEFRGKFVGEDVIIGELKIGLSESFLMDKNVRDGDFISFESSYINLVVLKKK